MHAPPRVVRLLASQPDETITLQIAKTFSWLSQAGNHVLTLGDPHYPRSLLDISDPPLLLYAKGRIDLLNAPSIAIVGSRNATQDGCANARRFAETLSVAGICIASGLALGIDGAAHEGGLCGTGSTVAVVGTGLDIVYPARHRALAHRIADAGCLLSEYPIGTPAIASNFPRRNRIISGLSQGVLVVEAAAQSGSLITASTALEQGREVFAIPGSIHSPLAKGCHHLIRQGAKLVESAQDILEEFPQGRLPVGFSAIQPPVHGDMAGPHAGPAAPADPLAQALLSALGHDPVSLDELAMRTNLGAAALNAALLALELDGRVESLSGCRFRRAAA